MLTDCNTCREKEEMVTIPYVVHESAMEREERHIKRLIVGLILAIVLLFASNLAWLYVWQSYDFESYAQDGQGVNIIGNTNEVQQYEPTTGTQNQE